MMLIHIDNHIGIILSMDGITLFGKSDILMNWKSKNEMCVIM